MASSRYLRAHRDQFHRCCLSSSENWSQVDQLIAPPLGFPPTTAPRIVPKRIFFPDSFSLLLFAFIFFVFVFFLFSKLEEGEIIIE